jgi:Fur family transcriptional regulator, ferric uptake regulator
VRERETRQKSAIRALIEKSRNPLLPNEILERAQQAVTGLGMATIYRNLKALVEAGEVRAVELPGEPTRFESAHLGHHHHFQCRVCGKVFDVQSCPGNLADLAPRGFIVERHELTLYGQCLACTAPQGERAASTPLG